MKKFKGIIASLLTCAIRHTIGDYFWIVCFLIFCLCGCGDNSENIFKYEKWGYRNYNKAYVDGTYAIIGYKKLPSEDIIIPIEYKGIAVTDIRCRAFRLCDMTSVSMDSIMGIWDEAFMGNTKLVSIDLGKVEDIGPNAFAKCSALESVIIPATVRSIEPGAFEGCTSLKTVYFEGAPKTLKCDIFDSGVVIYGPPGSTVEEYAKKYNLEFVSWKPEEQ